MTQQVHQRHVPVHGVAGHRLNLASFVTTWMEPEAEKLIQESANVNYVDAEQYPSSTEIQNRWAAQPNLFVPHSATSPATRLWHVSDSCHHS